MDRFLRAEEEMGNLESQSVQGILIAQEAQKIGENVC